jgi:hypothetical protein
MTGTPLPVPGLRRWGWPKRKGDNIINAEHSSVRAETYQQLLNSLKQLLDGDRRLPVLVLVEEAQAHCSGGVDVRMEEGRLEPALGRRRRIVVLEDHLQLKERGRL